MKRRTFLATGAGVAALPLAAPAIAQGRVQWNLASSFPTAAPGVGTNVTRYAELVRAMSDGRMEFNVYGAGELVGPFQVEDAVQAGNAPVGHAPPYYSAGREPATHWFTGVPFGMTSAEHVAWLRWGGGQEIWDDIYAQRNLKPFYSGNSNTQSGGWFKDRITGVDDLKGLNMRIAGLGGEMMRHVGVNAVLMPAGEIFTALQSGAIDAAEWVGPMLDRAFGLQRITKLCYVPAFAEPAAAVAVIFNTDAWAELPADLQAICGAAAHAAALEMHAQFDYYNAQAMHELRDEGVEFLPFPDDVVEAMRNGWQVVREDLRSSHPSVARVLESYEPWFEKSRAYSRTMTEPLLSGRG